MSGVSLASGAEAAFPPALADRFAVCTMDEGSWCVGGDREPMGVRTPEAAGAETGPAGLAP
jgi:hypothetical protein